MWEVDETEWEQRSTADIMILVLGFHVQGGSTVICDPLRFLVRLREIIRY